MLFKKMEFREFLILTENFFESTLENEKLVFYKPKKEILKKEGRKLEKEIEIILNKTRLETMIKKEIINSFKEFFWKEFFELLNFFRNAMVKIFKTFRFSEEKEEEIIDGIECAEEIWRSFFKDNVVRLNNSYNEFLIITTKKNILGPYYKKIEIHNIGNVFGEVKKTSFLKIEIYFNERNKFSMNNLTGEIYQTTFYEEESKNEIKPLKIDYFLFNIFREGSIERLNKILKFFSCFLEEKYKNKLYGISYFRCEVPEDFELDCDPVIKPMYRFNVVSNKIIPEKIIPINSLILEKLLKI